MAIDPETYRRYLIAEKMAKDLGLPLSEVLDRARLLMTKQRQLLIETRILEDVWRRLDRQSPNKLMSHFIGRADGTASEMLDAVKAWFEVVLKHLAEGRLEDL